jgi:hypothetical protein
MAFRSCAKKGIHFWRNPVADSNAMQKSGPELSGLETNVEYLTARRVAEERYRMPYSTFQKHLRALALSGAYPGAFRFTQPLPGIARKRSGHFRIEIHPVRGIEVLDKHFGFIERYGVRRGV